MIAGTGAAEALDIAKRLDEESRSEMREAYEAAGEMALHGLEAAAEDATDHCDLALEGEQYSLSPPIVEAHGTEAHTLVTTDCTPAAEVGRYMDKVEAVTLGAALITAYGISRATQLFRGRDNGGNSDGT
jgi:hypothetical protein